MATRKPYIGGNWKMNLHSAPAQELARALATRLSGSEVDVTIFPAFPYLAMVAQAVREAGNTTIRVGAQDASPHPDGAMTGEVSLGMLQDVGCAAVLAGHSERRHAIGEPDTLVNEKVLAAIEAGMGVVLCIGETLAQREAGQTHEVNLAQLAHGLAGVKTTDMDRMTIAYEPVWAIGTGKTATPEDAQDAHARIRGGLQFIHGSDVAEATRIQYGGSVKPANAAKLFAQPDIDGGLIGGASLKADDFAAIVEAA